MEALPIIDRLTGYGFWQYHYSLHNSEGSDAQTSSRTRLGYAGLESGEAASPDYGRNYGLVYGAPSYTDTLPLFGGESGYTVASPTGRSTDVRTWRNSHFFGLVDRLNLAAQYQIKNDRGSNIDGARRSSCDGFALSTSYDFDFGLSFAGVFVSRWPVSC